MSYKYYSNTAIKNIIILVLVIFVLPEEIFLQERLKDRQVPDVDNPQPYSTRDQERERQNTKIEEALIIHPPNDEDPDEKGDNVKFCISAELHGALLCLCDNMEDSSLVKDCIELSDKTEDSKAYGHVGDESPSKADNDKEMVEEEHAGLAVEQHVHSLC